MPLSYEIDAARGFVRTTVTGRMAVEELFDALEELFERPDVPVPYRELWDARQIGYLAMDAAAARRAIATIATWKRFENARVALVAGEHDVVFGLSRLTEVIADMSGATFIFRAFREIDEAEEWLLGPEPNHTADERA